MARRSNLTRAALTAAVLAAAPTVTLAADAAPIVRVAGGGGAVGGAPLPRIWAGCVGFCRAAYPPCRVGSRWYGPYGYVCYRPEPGSIVLR